MLDTKDGCDAELNRRNGFWALRGDDEESSKVEFCTIDFERALARPAAIEFHVAWSRRSKSRNVERGRCWIRLGRM